jgi:predicted transcriptional regulator
VSDSVVISIRVPVDLAEKVDRLAKDLERPRNYVAVKALEEYVASELEWVSAVKNGIEQADAGLGIPHEKVRPWLQALARGKRIAKPKPRRQKK